MSWQKVVSFIKASKCKHIYPPWRVLIKTISSLSWSSYSSSSQSSQSTLLTSTRIPGRLTRKEKNNEPSLVVSISVVSNNIHSITIHKEILFLCHHLVTDIKNQILQLGWLSSFSLSRQGDSVLTHVVKEQFHTTTNSVQLSNAECSQDQVYKLPEFDIDVQGCHGVCVRYVSWSRERERERAAVTFWSTAKFVVNMEMRHFFVAIVGMNKFIDIVSWQWLER